MKDENIVNMAYFMGRLLKPFVAIWAPVYALHVKEPIMMSCYLFLCC